MARERERREMRYTSSRQRALSHKTEHGSTKLNIPKGMEMFQPKEPRSYKVDILPYLVKRGKKEKGGNPYAEKGTLHFERTYYAHYGIGAANKSYVCPAMTFGKPCPVCEDMQRMRQQGADKEALSQLKPKERQLFLVADRTSEAEEAKGVKLWEISNYCFGALLDEVILKADDDDRERYENFFRLDEGSTLRVTFAEQPMGTGGKFLKALQIEFKARKEPLDDDLIEQMPDLDDMLVEIPYDRFKAIYENREVDDDAEDDEDAPKPAASRKASTAKPADEDEEEPPARTRKNPPKPDDDDEDTPPAVTASRRKPPVEEEEEPEGDDTGYKPGDKVRYDDMDCVVTKAVDGVLTLKDGDGKTHKNVDPIEVELVKDKPRGRKPADEDEEPEEEDETPPKRPSTGGRPARR